MSAIPRPLIIQISERFQNRCGYCQSQQQLMGVSLTIDHIIPQSLGGASTLENLCLACWDCNLAKSDRLTVADPLTGIAARIFNPQKQVWNEHFQWQGNGTHIYGLTATGRATVVALKLNRPQLVESRVYWIEAGWHPPIID